MISPLAKCLGKIDFTFDELLANMLKISLKY